MSWTDIFKPKAARLKADPAIRWFGKLPTYADYYSSRTDEDWVVEFHEWVLKGFEIYHGRWASFTAGGAASREAAHSRRLPISECVLRLPRSGMTVFTSIQDYGGDMRGRPFPLCFYAGLPSALWSGPASDALTGAFGVLRQLAALQRDVNRFFKVPARFDTVFEGREVDFDGLLDGARDVSWRREAGALAMAEWFDRARPALDVQELGAWLPMVNRWGGNIAALESDSFEPTLCFPLAAGTPIPVQAAGWMRWLESRMDVGRRTLSLFVVDEPGEQGCPRLVVVARDLVADDFLLVTPLSRALSYLDDLTALKAPAESNGSTDGEGERLPAETWAAFVERGGARSPA
jgi:hypothetical protein